MTKSPLLQRQTLRRGAFCRALSQSQYTPLTQSERFHHYIKRHVQRRIGSSGRSAATGAAILQGTNTPGEWGQGGEGYAKRLRELLRPADHIASHGYGAADALHEDNRYLPSGTTGVGARLKYAVASTFLARKDDGSRRFSYSRIGSTLAVAFISREWQPPSEDTPRDAAVSFGTVLASEVGFNIVREFWPKILKPH